MRIRLKDLFTDIISGEWGEEDNESKGVSVIRTANFKNDGKINYENVVTRLILKKVKAEDGELVWVVDEEKIENKKLKNGDILIEKSGGGVGTPVGRVVYFTPPDDKTYLSNNFSQTLRVDNKIAYPKYVFYYLKYLYKKGTVLKYNNQTTGIFNLKLERYLQEEIYLPSLDVQYSITTQLDTIQDLIDKRIDSNDLFSQISESIFFMFFGDPYTNPKKWKLRNLENLKKSDKNSIKAGPFGSSLKKEFYVDSGYKVYGQEQVIKNDLQYGSYYITEEKYKELETCKVSANDVLISLVGTFGKVSIVPEKFEEGIINPRLIKISFDTDKIEPIYFKKILETNYLKAYLSNFSKAGTVSSLNLKILKKIKFPVPDIELQRKYSTLVKIIDLNKLYINSSLEILVNLFYSVLQNAFKEDVEIDEEPIFGELVKKFSLDDLRGNKERLQFLINLFEKDEFENIESYSNVKENLFELIEENEITQILVNDQIILQVK